MSRFHFEEDTLNGAISTLNSIKTNIGNNIIQTNNALLELYGSDGFNISYAINGLKEEINKANNCIQQIETGEYCLDRIIRTVRLYIGNASIVDVADDFVYKTMDKVSSKISGKQSVVITGNESSDIVEEAFDLQSLGYPKGSWVDPSDENFIAIPNNSNSIIRVDRATKGENYMVIQPITGELFKKGTYRGYIQTTEKGLDGWFDSGYQCVATAKATTDMYNGINSTPEDWYSMYHYSGYNDGGWAGECWSTDWATSHGNVSNQNVVSYCVNQLKQGKATTIYAFSYNYGHNDGHALTVIGYENGGTGIEDLLVINPYDGSMVKLGESNFCGNGYYTGNFDYHINN